MNEVKNQTDLAIAQIGEIRQPHSEFFKFLGDANVEDVKAVLGCDLGSFLHGLCPILNLDHPDLQDVLSYHYTARIQAAIEVAAFVRKRGLAILWYDLVKILKADIKEIESKIRMLKMCARLLQKGERDACRLAKKQQIIDLSNAHKKWNENIPFDFEMYVRHNTEYKVEIKRFEKQAEHFENLGCESMCKEIKKSLDVFRESFNDTHYGFHRITMTLVALILGKMHNCSESDTYVPVAYPAHEFCLPDRIKKIIDTTEQFVEAGKNPIFDYYIVVSPKQNLYEMCSVLLGECNGKCYFISVF
jgi:hypothetical protein